MDHYTPTGHFVYQYPSSPPFNDVPDSSAFHPAYHCQSSCDRGQHDASANAQQSLELHAPIPISGQPIPLVDYYPQAADESYCGLQSVGLPEPFSSIYSADSTSPNVAHCQMSDQSNPFIGYPLAKDILATYFPAESAELSTVFSSMQLACTGSPTFGLCQTPQSPSSSSEYSDHCKALDPPQPTFPTPSELLAELAEKGTQTSSDDMTSTEVRTESASKARRRAMAKRIGFIPTDPDTISSHDKKRFYLESLEQYIVHLHEQYALLGREHPPLQQVAVYRGLSSRSIRTILVHMENTTRDLNIRTLAEEEKFSELREEILRREDNAVQVPALIRRS